jgi:hypothetical protein
VQPDQPESEPIQPSIGTQTRRRRVLLWLRARPFLGAFLIACLAQPLVAAVLDFKEFRAGLAALRANPVLIPVVLVLGSIKSLFWATFLSWSNKPGPPIPPLSKDFPIIDYDKEKWEKWGKR